MDHYILFLKFLVFLVELKHFSAFVGIVRDIDQ